MTVRYVCGALAAILLTCGLPGSAPANAQTHDASLLPPEESALITIMGCFQLGGKHGDEFVLASPTLGPKTAVQEATCRAVPNDQALRLKNHKQFGMNESMLGRWVEVSGRLEKEESTDPENLREYYVRSFRMMPVIPPRAEAPRAEAPRAEAAPVHVPPAQYQPEPATPPPATTVARVEEIEITTLPRTATPLPAFGLLGLLSLGGGLVFRLFGRG